MRYSDSHNYKLITKSETAVSTSFFPTEREAVIALAKFAGKEGLEIHDPGDVQWTSSTFAVAYPAGKDAILYARGVVRKNT